MNRENPQNPNDMWTVGRMLEWMSGYLEKHGDASALVSSRWLIADVLGLSFMELYTNYDRPLNAEELACLRGYVKRRAAGEPVQYIVGKTSFRHIDVMVRKGVLIPRPETEVLVSEALSLLPHEKYNVEDVDADVSETTQLVADICTGSGCIACSIAQENPQARVIATDIAPECVALARENADALGLAERVSVLQCDLGAGIDSKHLGGFDAVVSNPPYIPSAVLSEIPEEVRDHEPACALDGGEDGLDVFRRIATWSASALKAGGFMALELHETTLDDAADFAKETGFQDVRIAKDLAGKPRILIAIK